jgi:4-hydroxybenzoyl-CoA thioesterase
MGYHVAVKVRFSDVDNAGIVYYPRFFHYFHVAFEELFSEKFGIPYVDVLNVEKIGFPAVRVENDFKAPLKFGDVADVEISVEKVGAKSIVFRYQLRRGAGGPLCADGKVTVATVDMVTFKAVALPEKYRKLFAAV